MEIRVEGGGDNRTHRLLHNQSYLGRRGEMVHLEIQYFNLNRILLLAIGLWPYQQSKLTRFQFIFSSIILTTGIIFQVKVEYNNNIIRLVIISLIFTIK